MSKRIKIFVLEDDLGINHMLCEVFKTTPYECKSIACDDALDFIEVHPEFWYLLFVDLMMPGMTGWEFLKRVKPLKETRMIRLVVITGLGSSEWGSAVMDSDSIITKPFSIEDVLKEVEFYYFNKDFYAAADY